MAVIGGGAVLAGKMLFQQGCGDRLAGRIDAKSLDCQTRKMFEHDGGQLLIDAATSIK